MSEVLLEVLRAGAAAQLVLLAVWLVVGVPLAGARRRGRLQDALRSGGRRARMTVYRRTAVGQAAVATYAVVLALLAGASPQDVGLRVEPVTVLAALLVLVAALVGIGRARSRGLRSPAAEGLGGVDHVLPRTARERSAFLGVALVVGAAEEVVYRGVLLWAAQVAFDVRDVVAALLVAVAFGLAHTWQGGRAVLVTGLLGAVLGGVRVLSGGVLLPAALHAAVDLRVLRVRPAGTAAAAPDAPRTSSSSRPEPLGEHT